MPAYVPGFDHDVFVSYAHVDNVSLSDNPEEGWVYTLKDNLKKLLSQKLGRTEWGDIWIDLRLPRDEPFPSKISDAVQSSATLLVVLSDGYLESDWCRQELELFLKAAAGKAEKMGELSSCGERIWSTIAGQSLFMACLVTSFSQKQGKMHRLEHSAGPMPIRKTKMTVLIFNAWTILAAI